MTVVRKRALVSGDVQGVGFRMNALVQAQNLGLVGFARNLPDGRVEVEAEGSEEAVDALLTWLETGPAYATVATVQVDEREPAGDRSFRVIR
ncbi:acylphosphatase [Parafrigoribacterium soli]|uniref:acylphosphatase n=1 Tax=Parafrigoribacterium soli TaxID=3144663 RepID=UPI0032EB77D3